MVAYELFGGDGLVLPIQNGGIINAATVDRCAGRQENRYQDYRKIYSHVLYYNLIAFWGQ